MTVRFLGSCILVKFGAILTACVTAGPGASPLVSGHALAQQRCAGCHAIKLKGESPNPRAPAFRNLYKRYPVEGLRLAFTKGLEVAHSMPRFRLAANDIDHLIAYLENLNPCSKSSSDKAAMERCFAPL